MKYALIGISLLALAVPPALAETLYVQTDLNDPMLAETALSIVECVSASGFESWELVSSLNGGKLPNLQFISEDDRLAVIVHKNGGETKLTTDYCTQIRNFLGLKIALKDLAPQTNLTPLQNDWSTEESTEKSFLQRNWAWVAGMGAIALGFVAYKHFASPSSNYTNRIEVR